MRIWDIQPGYLNRQSLLGEHRELHGIVSIIVNRKKGYARHPETIRWGGFGWALRQRHQLLAAEMQLRGYTDQSPVDLNDNPKSWPEIYIDPPWEQYHILCRKYESREQGRIPLPTNAQQLWQHHKYSVMARDYERYKTLGTQLAESARKTDIAGLAQQFVEILRQKPSAGGMRNALQHMWGYISNHANGPRNQISEWDNGRLLTEIQQLTMETGQPYLLSSTALSELKAWI